MFEVYYEEVNLNQGYERESSPVADVDVSRAVPSGFNKYSTKMLKMA